MRDIISVGSYKLDESGEPSSTIITSNNWPAMIDKAGLRGEWLELALIPINKLGGDWSLLQATQDSLREHSNLLKQRESELADLRAEADSLRSELEALNEKLEIAKKDSERLDFLEHSHGDGHFQLTQRDGIPEFDVEAWYNGKWLVGEGTELREAIDDAARLREGGSDD